MKNANQSSIWPANHLMLHTQIIQIDIQQYHICNKASNRKISLIYISTDKIVAD